MQERKQGNDGHLHHVMASLVIMYNPCFNLVFLLDESYGFVCTLRKRPSASPTMK